MLELGRNLCLTLRKFHYQHEATLTSLKWLYAQIDWLPNDLRLTEDAFNRPEKPIT